MNINELATIIKLKIEEINQPIGCFMVQQSVIDEIKKYKELLEEGIITEKEFTIKENEIIQNNKISME